MRPDFVDYRVAKQAKRYQPTLAETGRRCQLDVRDAALDAFGVNTVFHLRSGEVIKLFTAAPDSAEHEATVMNGLHLQAAGIAPTVLHQGVVGECPYLVMSRLPGGPLLHAWDHLPLSATIAIREQLGGVLRRLHGCALPTDRWPAVVRDNLPANTPPSWPAYLSARRQRTVARQRDKGCPPAWLRTMEDFLDEVAVHAKCPQRLGLLHGELNADHVFVIHESGRWRVSGLLDFQAAMMGDPEHEVAQAGFHCCVGEPAHLRALLRGYGYTDRELTRDLQLRLMAHFLLFAWCPFQRYIVKAEFNADVPPGDFHALATKWFDFGLVYKVSPPRQGMVFEPSVFYRTADFKSSSTRPKPRYIRDTLLYAGDEEEIAIHLFPDIDRLRVRLDDGDRQRLAEVGFATEAGKAIAIFVNEKDQAKIPDFKPTVYRFDAADFQRTASNEFVSRKPVKAIGVEQLTMPVVLERWRIQVISVPDVHDCEKRLQQAGIECAMQTNRKSDLVFRQLTAHEEPAGYQIICDTVDWLRGKGIKLWEKPLPRETYAARHQRGENYGLFVGGELAGVVSLVRGPAQQWAEELPDRQIMWMSTLTMANAFRGRGLGRQIVAEAISHLADRGEKMLYLDCKPGFLEDFYAAAGFQRIGQKTAKINRGTSCYLAEVVLMRRAL